jgi:hypothetical protein
MKMMKIKKITKFIEKIYIFFFEICKNKSKNLGYYEQKDYLYLPIKKSGTSAQQL